MTKARVLFGLAILLLSACAGGSETTMNELNMANPDEPTHEEADDVETSLDSAASNQSPSDVGGDDALRPWDEVRSERVADTFATEEEIRLLNECLEQAEVPFLIASISEGNIETVDGSKTTSYGAVILDCLQKIGAAERLFPPMVPGVDALPSPEFVKKVNQSVLAEVSCLQDHGFDVEALEGEFGFLHYELPPDVLVEDLPAECQKDL